jgi:hypothetical protein
MIKTSAFLPLASRVLWRCRCWCILFSTSDPALANKTSTRNKRACTILPHRITGAKCLNWSFVRK